MPREGVFVEAHNDKTHMSFMVLSDRQGRYRIEKLPAGEYQLSTEVAGYTGDPLTGVKLSRDQAASFDWSLRRTPVRWNQISIYQARKLWPASPVKDKIFSTCFTCHGFQTRMASIPRDAEGWSSRVKYMQAAMAFGLADRLNDQQADEIAGYLNSLFGETSVLPKSPEDAPGYQETVRPIGARGR